MDKETDLDNNQSESHNNEMQNTFVSIKKVAIVAVFGAVAIATVLILTNIVATITVSVVKGMLFAAGVFLFVLLAALVISFINKKLR